MPPLDPQAVINSLTVPESRATLEAQRGQLLGGSRPVQMYPTGSQELPLPPGFQRLETVKGVFHFNPNHVSKEEIQKATETGTENKILGLGEFSKSDIAKRVNQGEQPLTIVERLPNGVEVRAASGTNKTADHQIKSMQKDMAPQSYLQSEKPEHTLMVRLLSMK